MTRLSSGKGIHLEVHSIKANVTDDEKEITAKDISPDKSEQDSSRLSPTCKQFDNHMDDKRANQLRLP